MKCSGQYILTNMATSGHDTTRTIENVGSKVVKELNNWPACKKIINFTWRLGNGDDHAAYQSMNSQRIYGYFLPLLFVLV